MILVHGGFNNETLALIGGGILLFIGIVVAIHLLARRTSFYKNEFAKFSFSGKVIVYCLFLTVCTLVAYVITLVIFILVSRLIR